MGSKQTLGERVASLENECRNIVKGFDEMKVRYRENNLTIFQKLDDSAKSIASMTAAVNTLTTTVRNYPPPNGFSKKQQLQLKIAFLTSITSIVVAVITQLPVLVSALVP